MALGTLRFYDVVVFLHVFSVVAAFGVAFTYPVVVPLARRHHPRGLPHLHRMQALVGARIITPAATLVLLAGLYLAISGDAGFDFGDWWVGFGLFAILVILGLGGAFFAPTERRLAELAERDVTAAGTGQVAMSPGYQALVARWQAVTNAVCLLVALTILFMVLGARGVFA